MERSGISLASTFKFPVLEFYVPAMLLRCKFRLDSAMAFELLFLNPYITIHIKMKYWTERRNFGSDPFCNNLVTFSFSFLVLLNFNTTCSLFPIFLSTSLNVVGRTA